MFPVLSSPRFFSVWTSFRRGEMQTPQALPAAESDILGVLCWMGIAAPWMLFEAFRTLETGLIHIYSCQVVR